MNNIIDITDRSPGSRLELFDDIHSEQIIEALSIKENSRELPSLMILLKR